MRTFHAILAQLEIEGVSPITDNVDIVYDGDNDFYYLQLYPGGMVSKDTYMTPAKAIKKFQNNEVEWED